MRSDLRHLSTFVVVAETGSLARASERLHLTQAALSMQLKALQERLSVTLVERNGRGLSLTTEGERLLPRAREVVATAVAFERAAGALSLPGPEDAKPVAIGTILNPEFIRLGELLVELSALLPRRRTELRHGISGWVRKEVRAGRLDFGFYLGDCDDLVFKQVRIARVRYVVIGPRGWSRRLQVEWRELASLPWVGTPPDSVHHRLLSPLFRSIGATPNVVARVDQEASMIDLVRAGVGLSLAREDVAIKEAHVSGLALSRRHHLETDLSVIARRSNAEDPSLQALFDATEAVWRS